MAEIKRQLQLQDLELTSEPYTHETPLPGVLIIRRPTYSDNRGSFQEEFRLPDLGMEVKQGQISISKPSVLRGIHLEPQDKIITLITGKIFVVLLDTRENSPYFKEWISFDVDATDPSKPFTTVFIPEGVGNSFCVYDDSPLVTYQYCVSKIYDPKTAGMGVKYNDNELKIPWPVKNPIVSNRDNGLPTLEQFLNGREK